MRRAVTFPAFSVVFTVREVALGLRFFRKRLGFREQFRTGEPMSYAIAEHDAVSVHLMPESRAPQSFGRSSIYVFASDVDALHQELRARGCDIEVPPTDQPYGMRELSVRDPDGNRITFGQESGGVGPT